MNILPTILRRVVPTCAFALLSACHCLPRPGTGECAKTGVQTLGVEDDFVPPEAAPVLSPALTFFMDTTRSNPAQGFDGARGGAEFGASFRLSGKRLCTVLVEVRTRPGYPPHVAPLQGANNDRITIGRAPFDSTASAPVFHSGLVWPAGWSSGPRTLSVHLPADAVQRYINSAGEPMIDLYIHDDTNVDFIRVTHTYN